MNSFLVTDSSRFWSFLFFA